MRILIAGGGTGGHIYPAISIAKAIQELSSESIVEFAGTPAGLEAKIIPQAGFKIHLVSIGRLNRNVSVFERVRTLLTLPFAICKSFSVVNAFKPDVVLGVGGYASGPFVFAAALLGYRTLIWEPNAYPGLANRLLSRFVSCSLVVFSEAAQFMKNKNVVHVHMPVRPEIESAPLRTERNKKFHILMFGGSQGARSLNTALLEAVKAGGDWLREVEIVHQTGALDYERVSAAYAETTATRDHVSVQPYLHDMPQRYAWADLVISRAGTGTISELAACGKAAILIPLPTAADDHQTKNALALTAIGGAFLLRQNELTPQRLIRDIEEFKTRPEKITRLEENIRKFHKPKAAHEIAKIILEKR